MKRNLNYIITHVHRIDKETCPQNTCRHWHWYKHRTGYISTT